MGEETMSEAAASLKAVDQAEITILMDNSVDVFLPGTAEVRRPQLSTTEPWGERTAFVAEHGFSVMVNVQSNEGSARLLYDAGMSTHGLIHNMDLLNVLPQQLDCIVLSHGHADHTQGLLGVVERMGEWRIPIHLHPDAFLNRKVVLPDGKELHIPAIERRRLEERGIEFIEARGPTRLFDGMVMATGQIERTSDFEQGFPPHYSEIDGRWEPDPLIHDDQALVVNVKDKGLVVVTGCCHAGAINTLRYAQRLTGVDTIHALMGGLHLTGGIFEPIIPQTIAELKAIGPKCVMAGHCTGWKAIHLLASEMPDAYVPTSVGTTLVVAAETAA